MQQWKMDILMAAEKVRIDEQIRNGQHVRSYGAPTSPGPNTHPRSEEGAARHEKIDEPEDLEEQQMKLKHTISLKGRDFLETPREEDVAKDARIWALEKEKEAEALEHHELVSKLEAMREEEVSEWREKCKTREAEAQSWRDRCELAQQSTAAAQGEGDEALKARCEESEGKVVLLEHKLQESLQRLEETETEHQELVAKLEAMHAEEYAELEAQIARQQAQLEAVPGAASPGNSAEEWEAKTAELLGQQKTALGAIMEAKLAEGQAELESKTAELARVQAQLEELERTAGADREDLQDEIDQLEATQQGEKAEHLQIAGQLHTELEELRLSAAAKEREMTQQLKLLQASIGSDGNTPALASQVAGLTTEIAQVKGENEQLQNQVRELEELLLDEEDASEEGSPS